MIRYIAISVLGLVLCTCSPNTIDTTDEAEAAFKAYVSALNAGDIDAAARIYDVEPGFHWIERGGVQYESGAEAANSLRALSGTGASQMTVDTLKTVKLDDHAALISAHFDFTMFSDSGEAQFSFDGWMTVGMTKRAEGWKIAGGQTGPGSRE